MLLPPDRLLSRLRALPATPAVVELVDLGAAFQVVVAGRVRAYQDEARDCTHRARVAAVFVALTIDPASIAMPPPAPPPASVSAAGPPPSPSPSPSARARLDVAAAYRNPHVPGRISEGRLRRSSSLLEARAARDLAHAGHDVENSVRQPRFRAEGRHFQYAAWGELGRL